MDKIQFLPGHISPFFQPYVEELLTWLNTSRDYSNYILPIPTGRLGEYEKILLEKREAVVFKDGELQGFYYLTTYDGQAICSELHEKPQMEGLKGVRKD